MKRIVIVMAALAALTGCAKRPNSIAPAAIPMEAYTQLECNKLEADIAAEQANLTALSRAQNDAATGDAFMVFMVGVPLVSAAGGDKEGLIAVSKGKVQAMELAKLQKGC
ncbi:MAG: hypothetical protein KI789_18305 [Hoeflea sp.]|nr:hypothetical protein [Hoeflea sp.]